MLIVIVVLVVVHLLPIALWQVVGADGSVWPLIFVLWAISVGLMIMSWGAIVLWLVQTYYLVS